MVRLGTLGKNTMRMVIKYLINWYGWKTHDDSGNKIPNKDRMQYKYLKVIDGGDKPSEEVLNKMLTDAQAKWDAENGA